MADEIRVFDYLQSMEGGMDAGKSPLLIAPNQFAFGINLSLRGGYARTRPPYRNLTLNIPDEIQDRFTGKFQGACPYESSFGDDCLILSRGGKLFRIIIDGQTGNVSEITPTLAISTTADFIVPALNAQVVVDVVSETVLSVGQVVTIVGGQYEIVNRFTNSILVEYQGGSTPGNTITAGAALLDSLGNPIFEKRTIPDFYEFVDNFPAENYIVSLADNMRPVIFDGSSTFFPASNGVPSGKLGTYGMGRIWVVLNDGKSFRGGDLVFGSSGTIQNGYRDAILMFTENDFLNEGGDFQVRVFGSPYTAGNINGMQFLSTPDTSLGLGPLAVACGSMVFTVDAPVDRTTWKNLNYPIKTIALLDDGAAGPRNITQFKSDFWYRSYTGITSFIQARRNFATAGATATANTPSSQEVSPILDSDDINLLYYGSMTAFQNRVYSTVAPHRTTNGIIHKGLVDINFDLVSDLRQKLSPSWEGLQTGLDIFQVVKGRFDGIERDFAFADNDGTLELWEFISGTDDIFVEDSTIHYVPIKCSLESRSLTCGEQWKFQLKQLDTMELFFDEIDGTDIPVRVKFRPDQYPDWIDWHDFTLCAPVKQCSDGEACSDGQPGVSQYAARITLPKPPETCNNIQKTTVNRGYSFQIRLEWDGCLRFKQGRVGMLLRKEKMQGECPGEAGCQSFLSCKTDWFVHNSHGN